MKKSIWVLGLSLVLLATFGLDALAQTPKEGTESTTTSYYVTLKAIPLGEGRAHMTYEALGVTIRDTGKCTGIQGSYEFTRNSLRPAIEGIGQSYMKSKIQYKLP